MQKNKIKRYTNKILNLTTNVSTIPAVEVDNFVGEQSILCESLNDVIFHRFLT